MGGEGCHWLNQAGDLQSNMCGMLRLAICQEQFTREWWALVIQSQWQKLG